MEYVIYSAESGEGTIINITHNPELDLGYLKNAKGISSIKVLTPYMPVSHAHYVFENLVRNYNPPTGILPKAREPNMRLRHESLKRLLKDVGEASLKKYEVVTSTTVIPSSLDMQKVYEAYKCRMMEAEDIYKNADFFWNMIYMI